MVRHLRLVERKGCNSSRGPREGSVLSAPLRSQESDFVAEENFSSGSRRVTYSKVMSCRLNEPRWRRHDSVGLPFRSAGGRGADTSTIVTPWGGVLCVSQTGDPIARSIDVFIRRAEHQPQVALGRTGGDRVFCAA